MYFPNYQWISEPEESDCDFCDSLYIPHDFPVKFQIGLEQTTIREETFDTNPFLKITSPDLDFDFNSAATPGQEMIIYACDKVFRFLFDSTSNAPTYSIVGNVVYVILGYGGITADIQSRLQAAIANAMNYYACAISVSRIGGDFTINGINYSGQSYLDNSFGYITSPATVVANTNLANNFIWSSSKLCYIKNATGAMGADGIYSITDNLASGKRYVFNLDYSMTYGMSVSLRIDDGVNPAYSKLFPLSLTSSGSASVFFDAVTTGTHTLTLMLTDSGANNEGFCLNGYDITETEQISGVTITDCDDFATAATYTETYNGTTNSLIYITSTLPAVFKITLTSPDGTLASRWYEKVSQANCTRGGLIKLSWSHDCILGDLDYYNLPFENQLLLTGTRIKQPTDKIDSVGNVTASGKKKSTYRHTIAVYEFRFHPYTDSTQSILERAFEHKNITINDAVYYLSDGEEYQVSEIEHPVYTGRVQLYKDGTELIVSSCCCASIIYSGGTGI